uniref:T9SS type A sorting domain-containing protein n=1 Tax=candidate division WOR-3 bacterium TaxID=2052148 RepID=A0A7C4Y5K4_UNCW3
MIFLFSLYFDYYPYAYYYNLPIFSKEVFLPTEKSGILCFDITKKEYSFINIKDGLSSNFVKMISFSDDEETLVVLTNKKIDFFTRDGSLIRSFSFFLPLFPDTIGNCIYLKGRMIYVGFNNGISYFSIDEYPYGTKTIKYFFRVKSIASYRDSFYFATDSAIYITKDFRDTLKFYSGNFNYFKTINDTLYAFGTSGLLNVLTKTKLYPYPVNDIFIKYDKFSKKILIGTPSDVREYSDGVWKQKITGNFVGVLYFNDSIFGVNRSYGIGFIDSSKIRYFYPPLPGFAPACDFLEREGEIWTVFGFNMEGIFGQGLKLISKFSNGKWFTYNYDNSFQIPPRFGNIEVDSKGRIWIGIWSGSTYKTIYIWNPSDTLKPILVMPPDSTVAVTGMCFGEGDTMWIGGHLNYIYSVYTGGDTLQWKVYTVQSIVWPKNIVYDKNGTLYFGTASHNYENGVFYKEGEGFYKINYSFGEIIYSMERDREGNIWVGTDKGLFKIVNREVVKEYDYSNSNLYPGAVAGIAFSKDNTPWILQNGYGVLYLDKHDIWVRVEELTGLRTVEACKSMFVDSKNNLWIGTYQGIFKINLNIFKEEDKTIVFPNPVIYDEHKKIKIMGEDIKGGRLSIFNSGGSCVLEKYIDTDSVIVNVSDIKKPGNYFYIIIDKNNNKRSGRFYIIK